MSQAPLQDGFFRSKRHSRTMNLIILLLVFQLVSGFEGEVFRPPAKHITGSSSTRRVQTRTVTTTITVSTLISDPAKDGPRIPTWQWKCGKIFYDPGKVCIFLPFAPLAGTDWSVLVCLSSRECSLSRNQRRGPIHL